MIKAVQECTDGDLLAENENASLSFGLCTCGVLQLGVPHTASLYMVTRAAPRITKTEALERSRSGARQERGGATFEVTRLSGRRLVCQCQPTQECHAVSIIAEYRNMLPEAFDRD